MLYAIAELAWHPEVYQRALDEVLTVLGPSQLPTFDDYSKLRYCEAIIKETLRLHSPVSLVPKTCRKDLKIDNVYFPKDVRRSLIVCQS